MRCLDPRNVGFKDDGKTIAWSQKHYSKEYPIFQLPCGQCIECRLEYARQWAVRCVHESKMHDSNCFITLTYSDENLKSPKLEYKDFQLFAKKLRKHIFTRFLKNFGKYNWCLLNKQEQKDIYEAHKIGIFVTGEYGEQRKRPHWHAIIFNWQPGDLTYKYSNQRGDRVYSSETLDTLWGHGITEIGSVTYESAGYCARYAAKKLIHGHDSEHDYQPISKKSSHQAIGKKFLEKYWPDIFRYGKVILDGGQETTIPRYYEKWLKKNQPEAWLTYVTKTKHDKIQLTEAKAKRLKEREDTTNIQRLEKGKLDFQIRRQETRRKIIEQKFKQLQSHLKGDI